MTSIRHDASALAALRRLSQTAGASVDARELATAIRVGISDHDQHGAGSEYDDFHRWAVAHGSELTASARKVMGIYDSFVEAPRAHHQTGLASSETAKMFSQMKSVADAGQVGTPGTLPVGAPRPGETTGEQIHRMDRYFKRQANSAQWNPTGPSASSNCVTCSLAMAVDALGKEPEKFRKMGKEGIQPSIDWMAGKMGKKPLPGQPHNFGPTGLGQAETGAHAVGLHYGRISPTSRNLGPLDSALAKGRMVVLTAHLGPGSATYRHAVYNYQGPHGILIMGRTNNGKYLVADPLSRTGVRALDKATVESFLTYPDEGGLAVWP